MVQLYIVHDLGKLPAEFLGQEENPDFLVGDCFFQSVLQFITGAKSLDEWDQFCTDWHVQGGDQILELVKDYLAE